MSHSDFLKSDQGAIWFNKYLTTAAPISTHYIVTPRGGWFELEWDGPKQLYRWKPITHDEAREMTRHYLQHDRDLWRSVFQTSEDDADEAAGAADGPFGLDGFRYNSTPYSGLTPKVHRLIQFLWNTEGDTADFHELAEPVWLDENEPVSKDAVGSLRREANNFFKKHSIPYRLSISGRLVSLICQGESE